MAQVSAQTLPDNSRVMMGAGLAWLAVVIFAAGNSIVSLLAEIGMQNRVMGRNVITYCNLLFVGSLLSIVPMSLMFWRDWTMENLRKLKRKHWVILTLSAFLSSALTPGLFFYALEKTTVTNVVLAGRIEPPLFLLATWLFLREEFEPWAFVAGLVALGGAVVMLWMNGGGGIEIGKGEIGAFLATLSYIASTLVARTGLRGIPLGIYTIYRTVLGTIFYFLPSISLDPSISRTCFTRWSGNGCGSTRSSSCSAGNSPGRWRSSTRALAMCRWPPRFPRWRASSLPWCFWARIRGRACCRAARSSFWPSASASMGASARAGCARIA
jgi:uncharacterized membrane protein